MYTIYKRKLKGFLLLCPFDARKPPNFGKKTQSRVISRFEAIRLTSEIQLITRGCKFCKYVIQLAI